MQIVDLSAKIKLLCKTKKISLQSLLEQCNINRNFIYDLERKEKAPSFDKIIRIADCLDVSIDYLAGRTSNPEINK